MSYILDALRKAERERARGRIPGLATPEFEPAESGRLWVWIAGGAALAAAAALPLWLRLPEFLGTAAPPPVRVAPAPAPAIPEAPPARAESPAPRRPVPAPAPEPRAGRPAAPAPPPLAKAVPRAPEPPSPSRLTDPLEDLAPVRPPAETDAAPPASAAEERGTGTGAREARPSLPPPPAPRPSEAPARNAVLPSAPPKAEAPPVPLQEAIARMTLSVLVYSESKSDRMVYIDGRQYLEGQNVQGQYLVESITPDGAVLSANGERAVLRAKPDLFRGP